MSKNLYPVLFSVVSFFHLSVNAQQAVRIEKSVAREEMNSAIKKLLGF